MKRHRTNAPLRVVLNGHDVGLLRKQSSGAIDFRYAQSWLQHENAIAVSLSLPLREDAYIGEKVIAVLENLLPDNKPVRERVAARVGADGADAFSLLAAIGRDCVGALQFLGADDPLGETDVITGKSLSDAEIGALLGNLKAAPLGLDTNEDFRISVAGAQEKTALLWHEEHWKIPSGPTPTTHIIKPRIGRIAQHIDLTDSVENEYLCMQLCRAFGMPTANVTMEDFDGVQALIVERFDRLWARDGRLLRLPQEDFCQALSVPPVRKYENDGGPGILDGMKLLSGSDTPADDRAMLMKAQLLYWLLGATDGHAKNFSLFLYPRASFRMTPIYDVLSVQPAVDAGALSPGQFKLAMAVGTSRHYAVDDIVPRHFLQIAKQAGIAEQTVTDMITEIYDSAKDRIDDVVGGLPDSFPGALVNSIRGGIEKRLRAVQLWRRA